MDKKKKENFVYNLILCGIMTYFMGLMNVAIHMGGVNGTSILVATKSWPLSYVFAMIIVTFIIYPISRRATFHFVSSQDSKNAIIMFTSFFMACGMSLTMTLFKALMINGISKAVFSVFLENWPRNFCIAFLIQLIFVGPFARKMLAFIFRNDR